MIEVIKYQAPNCGPCNVVQSTLDRLQEHFPEVTFSTLDVVANPQVAAFVGVTKTPTVILLKNGVEMHRFVGAKFRYSVYEDAIEALLRENG